MIILHFHHQDVEIDGQRNRMLTLEITLLGLALGIDAALASFALGLLGPKVARAFIVAGCFGVFQTLMLWSGSYAGYLFTFSSAGHWFQLVVSILFIAIGAKIFYDSFRPIERNLEWGIGPLIILAFATSVDALAAGVGFATLPVVHLAAIEVGVITFFMCGTGYFAATAVKNLPERWLMRFAGVIFLCMGGNNFVKHFF